MDHGLPVIIIAPPIQVPNHSIKDNNIFLANKALCQHGLFFMGLLFLWNV